MTNDEKNELTEEIRLLKILLDFHILNKEHISLTESEFVEYVDAILDRLNELKNLIGEKPLKK